MKSKFQFSKNVICWHFSIFWTCATYPVGNTLTLLIILIQSYGVHWYCFCIFWLQNVQSVSNLFKFPPTFIFIAVFNCWIVWFSHFLDLDIWGYLCFEVPGTRTFAFPHTFCHYSNCIINLLKCLRAEWTPCQ